MTYKAFDAYLSVVKSTPADIYKDEFQSLVDAEFENATTVNTVLHNGVPVTVRVVGKFDTETVARRNDNYQKIIFRNPDYEVNIGDIFEFYDAKWICTDISSTPFSKSCTVTRSYFNIYIYKNGIIHEVPCIVEDTIRLYSMGIKENEYIMQPFTDIIVRVPNNEITSLIRRGEVYRIGKDTYKAIDISDVVNPGLIVIKFRWTSDEQYLPSYTIKILNGDNIQINRSQQFFIKTEVRENGEIITSPPLLYHSSDENIATIDKDGMVTILGTGTVTFTVTLVNDPRVSDSIIVDIVEDEPDLSSDNKMSGKYEVVEGFTISLAGDEEIIKGRTKTYIAQKYNSEIVDENAEFTFEIIPGDTPPNAYELNVISHNQCSITAKSATYYIILRATDNVSGQYVEKIIKLRNLF